MAHILCGVGKVDTDSNFLCYKLEALSSYQKGSVSIPRRDTINAYTTPEDSARDSGTLINKQLVINHSCFFSMKFVIT